MLQFPCTCPHTANSSLHPLPPPHALPLQVVRQNPRFGALSGFCKSQCQACVVAVSKCKLGAKQQMPQVCAQAFRIPQVMKIVNQYMSRTASEKAPARGL